MAIRLERAVASGDAAGARRLLPSFVALFRHEPLLVCPPTDGGTPAQAVRAQTALQTIESLLARLPRLGLLRETYQLTKLARVMERNDPPEGRRVSSFDQLFRTAVTGVVDALLTSARDWGEDAGEDGPLASALRQVADSFQGLWVDHSVGLRLSTLESVLDADDWEQLRAFVRTYGGDLFTVRFLTLSNVRGILGQGTAAWLDREAAQGDPDNRPKLVEDWADEKADRTKAARQFEVVLQSLVEHYDEYRDYNTTTTQSDYGENLYILLDFLRLKVTYDRYAWRLRPMVLAHEVLCRRGFDRLAAKWREFLAGRTEKLAKELLDELTGPGGRARDEASDGPRPARGAVRAAAADRPGRGAGGPRRGRRAGRPAGGQPVVHRAARRDPPAGRPPVRRRPGRADVAAAAGGRAAQGPQRRPRGGRRRLRAVPLPAAARAGLRGAEEAAPGLGEADRGVNFAGSELPTRRSEDTSDAASG